MEYSVRAEPGYLLVRMTGTPSEQEIRAMLRDLTAHSAGTQGALFELKVDFGLNLTSTKDLVSGLPSLGFPAGYRLALLLLDDAAARSAEFAEDVAFNRGIGLRVFRDREQAIGWASGASP
jgi:hypothetical protein